MKKKKLLTLMCTVVIGGSLLLLGCGKKQASNDKDYTVNLGYYNCDHMVAACVAKDAGIFDKLGLKVNVTGNGKVPEAMAAGKMDVGYIGTGPLFSGEIKGSPIEMVANNHKGGSFYLIANNNIKTPKELVGKKLAIGSKPQNDLAWVVMANQLKIPIEGTSYKPVDMSELKDKYLAFKTGKIDGYITCDPWGSMAEYEKTGHIMDTYLKPGKEWGDCCVFSMNKNFVKEHPELAEKMIKAHVDALEYVYTHPVESAKIFAKNYNVPEEVALMTIYKKTVGEGRTLTWVINPNDVKHEINSQVDVHALDKAPKYDNVVDTSLIEKAKVDDFNKFIKEKVDPVFPEGMTYDQWKAKAEKLGK